MPPPYVASAFYSPLGYIVSISSKMKQFCIKLNSYCKTFIFLIPCAATPETPEVELKNERIGRYNKLVATDIGVVA